VEVDIQVECAAEALDQGDGASPVRWQTVMHMGYVAYGLLILRAIDLELLVWTDWLSSPQGLPPPRLLLSLFATAVIVARLSVRADIQDMINAQNQAR